MNPREPAWRVLAHEFQASLEEERGTGDRAASYLLSPLGARMNRILVAGTLAPSESIGREASQPFLRSKLTDPTGSFTVTAGGFQPRALAALRRWTEPAPAMVVGKSHLFRGRDGVAYGSVRVEALRRIQDDEYRVLLADAIEQTRTRAELVRRVRAEPTSAQDPAFRATFPARWVDAAVAAIARYPTLDPASFLPPLDAAESIVVHGGGPSPAAAPPAAPVERPPPVSPARITRAAAPPPRDPPTAAERAEEGAFLDIVDELSEHSADGYADLHETLQRAASRGVGAVAAEELLNRLEESGVIEEPIVGKLRRA